MNKQLAFILFLSIFSLPFLLAKEPTKILKLNSGYEMPSLGLGTWTLTGQTCEDAVYAALKSGGRRHTAEHLKNPVVLEIAKAHKKSAAQIIIRWHLQSGYITIPGSSNPAHIAENFDVWDFELTENEMKKLNALDTGRRYENW